MKQFCGDADCPGEDKDAGDYCQCRKTHYSLEDVLITYLKDENLLKNESGIKLWDGAKYIDWREYEKWIKERNSNKNPSCHE